MKSITLLVITAFLVSTMGCMEGMSREEKTAVGGALVGATVGGIIGSKSANAGKGILIGAAAGAVGGYLVGKMTAPKEGEAATVVCPHCQSLNELPPSAKAGSIIQCGVCGKQFQLQ